VGDSLRSTRLESTEAPSLRTDDFGASRHSPDLLDVILVTGAFVAPMDLHILKNFTVYDLSIALLAFLVVAGPLRLSPLPPAFLVAASLFLATALLSTFRAPQPVEALTQTLQYAFIFFVQIPVIVTVVRSRAVLRAVLIAFIAGTLVGILTAFALRVPSGAGRLQTIFDDTAGHLGQPTAYLLPFVLFFLAGWWRSRRRLRVVVIGGVAVYLLVWALAASGSRAGAIGTAVSLFVFVGLRGITERPRHLTRRAVLAAAMIALLAFLVFRTGYFPSTLNERVTRTFTPGDDLSEDRIDLNEAGVRAFAQSPLLGVGLDNFRFVAWRYGSPGNQAPHNMWIQFLTQVGIVGTVMMLLIIGGWFLLLLRAHLVSKDRSGRDLLWAFLACGAALISIFMTAPLMVHRQYWLIIALGAALAWQPSDGPLALPVWLTGAASDLPLANAGVRRMKVARRYWQPSTQEPRL
jgi:O-antigen ligase